MTIEKKFKMFSTKEWIQFLQYKLSPEREKELEAQLSKDSFLKEAVDIIGDKENRALAHQSISSLISEVQHYTGVSESKIAKSKDGDESAGLLSEINWKYVGIVLGSLLLLGVLGFSIFYFFSSKSNEVEQENVMLEAEPVSNIQSYADSSSLPMETLPKAVNPEKINSDSAKLKPIGTFSTRTKSGANSSETAVKSEDKIPNSTVVKSSSPSLSVTAQKERELFNQAQEIYKQGNREEAKKILRELKSYDNSMKTQAETILKNMENQKE